MRYLCFACDPSNSSDISINTYSNTCNHHGDTENLEYECHMLPLGIAAARGDLDGVRRLLRAEATSGLGGPRWPETTEVA